MYRRSGMGRLEFKQALQLGRYSTSLLTCKKLISLSGLGEVHVLGPHVRSNGWSAVAIERSQDCAGLPMGRIIGLVC